MQLANTAAVLGAWSKQLPCRLQTAQLQPNNTSELFYQAQAAEACNALQYVSSYMRIWIGDVTYMLVDSRICEGLRAVQVLQAFATIVCLFVLPLSVLYAFERCYKLQFLRSLAQADTGSPAAAAGSASTRSSRGDSATGSSSISNRNVHQAADSDSDGMNSSSSSSFSRDRSRAVLLEEPGAAVMLRWSACVVAMLAGAWLLAEVLVTDVFGDTTCPACTLVGNNHR
jgi:hypothetical protein